MARLSLRAAGTAVGCRHSYLSKLVKEGRLHRGSDGLVSLDDVRSIMAQADPSQRRKPVVTGAGHQSVTTGRSPRQVTTLPEADLSTLWVIVAGLPALIAWGAAMSGSGLQLAFDLAADVALDIGGDLALRGFAQPPVAFDSIDWRGLAEEAGLDPIHPDALAADWQRRRDAE